VAGPTDQRKVDRIIFKEEREVYYKYAGIEEDTGKPTREMMEILNLNEIADMLE